MDYWDLFRDLGTAFQKALQNYKSTPIFTEVLCKLFRKMLENNMELREPLSQIVDAPTHPAYALSIEIHELHDSALEQNIEFWPPMLE